MRRRRNPRPEACPCRVLLAAPEARDALVRGLVEQGAMVVHAWTPAEALNLLSTGEFDVVLCAEASGSWEPGDLVERVASGEPGSVCVVLSWSPTLTGALAAMRAGAADYWEGEPSGEALRRRFEAVLVRARRASERRRDVERLRRLCRQLNGARQEVSRQVGSLCTDLADAYKELADQFGKVTLACEFSGVVRQELEVESLLRTTLEFVLAKIGSTNAAIFLPAAGGEYSLGAYVNYDVPKDTAEMLLDQLAAVLAPRFENQIEVAVLDDARALEERLGEHAHWVGESALAALACRHDDETLAVVVLFRDRRLGFNGEQRESLRVIGDIFGRQLARVIQVHHRHIPKDQWGLPAAEEPDANEP